MSIGRGVAIFLALLASFLISSQGTLAQGQGTKVVVLANSIDGPMGQDFLQFITALGYDVQRPPVNEFRKYAQEKYIVILGGPDAYEGVGNITRQVLSPDEQALLRSGGVGGLYLKRYSNGQIVSVFAGSDRGMTKVAHETNRAKLQEVLEKGAPQVQEISGMPFGFPPEPEVQNVTNVTTPGPEVPKGPIVEVIAYPDTLSPDRLPVNVNTTVRWVNKRTTLMSIELRCTDGRCSRNRTVHENEGVIFTGAIVPYTDTYEYTFYEGGLYQVTIGLYNPRLAGQYAVLTGLIEVKPID